MGSGLTDLRLAVRGFLRTPAFTAIAVLSIALGIGANAAVFTLVDRVLLRTLPVQEPDRLVQATMDGSHYGNNRGDGSELSYPWYQELAADNQVFDGVLGRYASDMSLGAGGRTDRVRGELVTGSYFPVLGVQPALGRLLSADDDRVRGGHPVAVLSHGYWILALRRRPVGAQPADRRERPLVHRGWRLGCGVRRRRAGPSVRCLHPDDDEEGDYPGVGRAR